MCDGMGTDDIKRRLDTGILVNLCVEHANLYFDKQDTTSFPSGAIRDKQTGKTDFTETISWTAFNAYAKYMTSKAEKYGKGNFKTGIEDWSYTQSMLRHVDKYMRNTVENGNDEKDEDHLSAIIFNVFGLIHNREQRKLPNEFRHKLEEMIVKGSDGFKKHLSELPPL